MRRLLSFHGTIRKTDVHMPDFVRCIVGMWNRSSKKTRSEAGSANPGLRHSKKNPAPFGGGVFLFLLVSPRLERQTHLRLQVARCAGVLAGDSAECPELASDREIRRIGLGVIQEVCRIDTD